MFRKKIQEKDVYACKTGDYAGQMFIIIKKSKDSLGCLSIPEVKNVKIPVESFETGRNSNIIEYVETIPKSVYKISKAQYEKNENLNN
jgi:hypothetical protein